MERRNPTTMIKLQSSNSGELIIRSTIHRHFTPMNWPKCSRYKSKSEGGCCRYCDSCVVRSDPCAPLDDGFIFSHLNWKFTWNGTHQTRKRERKRLRFFLSKCSTFPVTLFIEFGRTICAPSEHTRQTETWVLLSSSFTAAIPALRAHVWLGLSFYYSRVFITFSLFLSRCSFICACMYEISEYLINE